MFLSEVKRRGVRREVGRSSADRGPVGYRNYGAWGWFGGYGDYWNEVDLLRDICA